jgi:hypothetical protein
LNPTSEFRVSLIKTSTPAAPFRTRVRRIRLLPFLVLTSAAIISACSDSSGPKAGVLASLVIQPTTPRTALAGTAIADPIVIVPTDAQGHTVLGESATFTVIAGGGSIAATTNQANSDGTITVPAWTLGKSAIPQQLQATVGGKSVTINATVQTAYSIEVRFFGQALSSSQKALFTDAANRLLGAVVGAVPLVNLDGADPANCGVTGQAKLTGNFNGVLIYASIDSIDAKGNATTGNVLANAGPCYIRTDDTGGSDFRTAVGVMAFDSADIGTLAGSGNLKDVIEHEMLHVLGVGSFWGANDKNLLVNAGTPTVAYTGPGGIAGCQSIGGTITCASTVPVEGSQGGDGTKDGHWRETTFGNELMTGFINSGTNPLSAMTIQSLEDFGYVVNTAAADAYRIPGGSFVAGGGGAVATAVGKGWERPRRIKLRKLPVVGLTGIEN